MRLPRSLAKVFVIARRWIGGIALKLATMVVAASFVIAPAAFTVCDAQTVAVSEHTFDWIFFAIVGIPFILVFVVLLTEGRGQIPPNRVVADKSERSYPPLADWK